MSFTSDHDDRSFGRSLVALLDSWQVCLDVQQSMLSSAVYDNVSSLDKTSID
jgi:hypothetical protein